MPQRGKIDRAFFETHIASRLGASRSDVPLPPQTGVDFGVIDVDEQALVVATDPISILPALGFHRAGRFATKIVLADAAVSGLAPTHLTISFTLPPSMTDEEFAATWEGIHEVCEQYDVAIAAGHTARYAECSYPWVGGATAIAKGSHEAIVRPDGASSGDHILVTRGPAVETTGLLTTLFPEQIPIEPDSRKQAQQRLEETGVLEATRTAVETGTVTAMHDATEGGLLGAFHEMANSAGVQFQIEGEEIPIRPGVQEVSNALNMDPWTATSSGTLVLTVDSEDAAAIATALEREDQPVGIVGRVTDGRGVFVDGEQTTAPSGDASWPVYERLAEQTKDTSHN